MSLTLRKIGNLAGLLAPVVWALAIVYSASRHPDYSHYAQYLSELGARGSSTELFMRYAAFLSTGVLYLMFAAFLYATFGDRRLAVAAALLVAVHGVARIGAGLFPCAPGCGELAPSLDQRLHSLSATIGYGALIGAAVLWGLVFRRYRDLRGLTWLSIAAGAASALFLLLMIQSVDARAGTGMYQRLSSVVMSVWVMAFAGRLWQLKAYAFDRLRLLPLADPKRRDNAAPRRTATRPGSGVHAQHADSDPFDHERVLPQVKLDRIERGVLG